MAVKAGQAASSRRRLGALTGPAGVVGLLLGAALVTWIVTIERMSGMDGGPGTDLGGLGWYVGVWVTMMAAMMLPSASPMVFLFARIARDRARRGQTFVPTWMFVAGYLAVWTGYGLAAYGVVQGVRALDLGFLAWSDEGPLVAGAVITAAGLYQLTPLKSVCLRHCKSPLHFVLHGWRDGRAGAVRMGATHGLYCVGCCWGLMLALFALGVMSVFWMAVVAAVIVAEKLAPFGARLARVVAIALVVLGIAVAASPSSVPRLTDPGSNPSMQMEPMQPASNSMTP